MKIEGSKTLFLNETILRENLIIPANELDDTVMEFIRCYKIGKFGNIPRAPRGQEISVTIALCILEEKEKWKEINNELQIDGWCGASLVMWSLYVQNMRDLVKDTVTLPGTLYRDDDFIEWIPLVRYQPRMFLKNVTEIVSMKHSLSLYIPKPRTVLISKIEVLKT